MSESDDKPEDPDGPSSESKSDSGSRVLTFAPPRSGKASTEEKPAAEDKPAAEPNAGGGGAGGPTADNPEAEDDTPEPEKTADDQPPEDGSDEDDRSQGPSDDEPAGDDKPVTAAAEDDREDQGNSNGLLLILAIAAAVVLAVIFINRSSNEDAPASKATAAKPNHGPPKQAKTDERPRQDGPEPRPPSTKTHAADPTLEALREAKAAKAEQDSAGQAQTGETGAKGEDTGTDTSDAVEAPPPEQPPAPAEVDDPRDPSLIPPGTPAENAKAFVKLPVSLNDGPPIGAIGRSGIHVDWVATAAGRDNSNCDDPTRSFTTDTEFINICLRVVHPRASETLRVIWEKDGSVTRRSKLKIPEQAHAYKTRAYLQMRPEYVGSWRVRIVPEGEEDTDLVAAQFTID